MSQTQEATTTSTNVTGFDFNQFAEIRARLDELDKQDGARRDAADVTGPVTRRNRGRPRKAVSVNQRSNNMNSMSNTNTQTNSGNSDKWPPTNVLGATPQAPDSNSPSFATILAAAKTLAADCGKGNDAQVKLALKVIEGAYLGALVYDPSNPRRHGVQIAEAYVRERQQHVIFDPKAKNQQKLISNTDKFIKLGSNPKWGMGEPLQTVNNLVTLRQKAMRANKKVKDAYNMLTEFSTAQLRSDKIIAGAELEAFIYKKDPESKSVEDVLEGIRKTARRLIQGKVSHCIEADNSAEVLNIVESATARLEALATAKRGNNP